MKFFLKHVVAALCVGIFVMSSGCNKKEDKLDTSRLPNMGGDKWVTGEIDNWIKENLTKPYNIEVKYKFDQFEAEVDKTLVPVREEIVIPSMEVMLAAFIQPYVAVRDLNFMKTYVPKQVVLVGSLSYNANGTATLGQAEGGKKILLLDMNSFSLTNRDAFIRMMHTMHHEFGHIFNQKVLYPPSFGLISKSDYTANWNQMSRDEAMAKGFVTPYAMSADGEDFVEIVSTMLAEGGQYYESIVRAQPANIQAIFRQKERMVIDYYRDAWDIDFYKLRETTQQVMDVYFPPSVAITDKNSNFNRFLPAHFDGIFYFADTYPSKGSVVNSLQNTKHAHCSSNQIVPVDVIAMSTSAGNSVTVD